MMIRRNTKEFKALRNLFQKFAGEKVRQLTLYGLKAGDTVSDRIPLKDLGGDQGEILYDLIYDSIRKSFGDKSQQLHKLEDSDLYFFRGLHHEKGDRNPFELKGDLKKNLLSYAAMATLPEEQDVVVKTAGKTKKITKTTKKKKAPVVPKERTYGVNHPVTLTNKESVYFPASGLKKKEVMEYYDTISPKILPHLKDRPLALEVYFGKSKKFVFCKNLKEFETVSGMSFPTWFETTMIFDEELGEEISYALCPDKDHLLFLVESGCIALHPWHSTSKHPDRPMQAVLSLKERTVERLMNSASVCRQVLAGLSLPSFVKISGNASLDIHIPLDGKADYDTTAACTVFLSKLIGIKIPGKVLPLTSHKQQGDTSICPYSLSGSSASGLVCMPLPWDSFDEPIDPSDFTLDYVSAHINDEDLTVVLKNTINAAKTLEHLDATYGFLF